MNGSDWTPPNDLWEVNRRLQFDEPLDGASDPRWVDTGAARSEYNHRLLYRVLGVDEETDPRRLQLQAPADRGYYLFCGHRGSG